MNQSRFEKRCCEVIDDILNGITTVEISTLSSGAVHKIKQISYDQTNRVSLIDNRNLQVFIK